MVQYRLVMRLIELIPFVTINYYWGIISKCLTYSKAASDPFVYSLLRQQYKKVLINIVNRILKRDLYPSSGQFSRLQGDTFMNVPRPLREVLHEDQRDPRRGTALRGPPLLKLFMK
ncbi:hypothetical protein DV515_00002969 [Chloebia gouldiae]|uniref:Uncharacterized protein n=1 Tax=Chloebia gouldiae TaxID=44316 RepID=A0A3L8SVT5_CHLGU|nr:hypothetical protein DV515_00002969 [Chloebia gouldiae]